MKYGSVCSGIEAASVAWHPLGWEPQWFSEIESFPSEVLKQRFPDVPNLGDMTQLTSTPTFNEKSIDLLVGGTPCQSFSVAGLRGGLADPRGNLMLTFLGLADAKKPKWIVWENVPGVLSSNGGKDFGTFLGALAELGYGFAYRVLDAQHFGVAQRRRRVFVIGHLGDWRPAAAVLFESESLQRNPKQSRAKGQEAPTDAQGGSRTTSPDGRETIGTLRQRDYKGIGNDDLESGRGLAIEIKDVAQPIAVDWRTAQVDIEMTGTLKTDLAKMSGPCVAVDAYNQTINEKTTQNIGSSASDVNHYGAVLEQKTVGALCARDYKGVGNQYVDEGKCVTSPVAMAIRRLTPKECERLQGFPELKSICTFRVWLDPQNSFVNVAIKCHKKQVFASNAGGEKSRESALCVNQDSLKDQGKKEIAVELLVHTGYDQKVAEIHKIEKSLSNVLNAEQKSEFLQHIQAESFVRQIVGINTMLEKKILNGREELPLNTMHFTQEQNGKILALLFGQEKDVNAKDVEKSLQEVIKFITSSQDQSFQSYDMNCQTWLFFVLNVIGLFIQEKTQKEIFFDISTQSGWTQIPYRNKSAEQCPDGPRYKACGNSMAVPVMRWIGERIQMVELLMEEIK